ncbi:MAG: large repetitive protein [Acidobacteriota bacterium]|jgi:subtilase family serine protease|nr:large repetitive protein [Acidobacteriota bacterium]
MVRNRSARLRQSILFLLLLALAPALLAQVPVDKALGWFNTHQNADGTWGSGTDLAPRDTARVLIAQSISGAADNPRDARFVTYANGLAWLGGQRGFDANQFLSEQAMALAFAKLDPSVALVRLAQQRSNNGPDYGGFLNHTGDTYDSALAVQALATSEKLYGAAISGAVQTILIRQNPDGGWGIDGGFASNPVLTAEVLMAFASLTTSRPPQASVLAAQAYLANGIHPDGSIGNNLLETATAFRALALSGSTVTATTLTYLGAQQAGDGSWGNGDAYLTARILEAYAANKPNLTIRSDAFTLTPAQTSDGSTVTAKITVSNIGAQQANPTTLTIYAGAAGSRSIGTKSIGTLAPSAISSVEVTFAATEMVGTQTITAVADSGNVVSEIREDDNSATATLTVSGKPDLVAYANEITTAPARLQPNQQGTLAITIHNIGEGDATSAGYAIYDTYNNSETLLKKSTVAAVAAKNAQVISIPVTLAGGVHSIRVVVDPDALIAETDETNNATTKSVSVNTVSNVDLRIRAGNVTAVPVRPTAGQSVALEAIVENAGTDPVQSTVAFFDGVPGAGGVVITAIPVTIDAQSSVRLAATFTAGAQSRVVYAVADADNVVPEIDETNNQAYIALTDQFADLSVSRDGFVLPRNALQNGQTLIGRLVVRNNGILPATGVTVAIYDDLPQRGGLKIVDTVVDIPAQGKVVVPASWPVRAGQRFATAVVNAGHSVFEPDYTNNRVTKFYVANGNQSDLSLSNVRSVSIDTSAFVISPVDLTVGGFAKVSINSASSQPFSVLLFEDVDGDGAFDPETDNPLGSTIVQPGNSQQIVTIAAQGTVRFAPGKLLIYIDSTNAIPEGNEGNNLIDLWQDCWTTASNFAPGAKWTSPDKTYHLSPVARLKDTNGDDIIDENDTPFIVHASGGAIILRRGDTGQIVWSQNFNFSGRQISPVIADVDGDGKPEIIVHAYEHKLVALNVDGTTKWTSPNLDRHPDWELYLNAGGGFIDYSYGGAPVVADLDGDGFPEVISGRSCLDGRDGSVKWVGGAGAGRAWDTSSDHLFWENFPDQEAPIAADVDGDGRLDVVAGNTVYRADGSIIWQRPDLGDGYTAAVYLANQTKPNIALVSNGRITMLNPDGTTKWGPTALPGGAMLGGAPTVFMISNGGGGPYVGVAGDANYTVWDATTGAQRWTRQVNNDFGFGFTVTNSATVYDFGFGTCLVYSSHDKFQIMRAADGGTVYSEAIGTNAFYPMSPVVADVDGDGRADVVVPGRPGLKILSDPTWPGARAIFNEASYHITNVAGEGGAIPKNETQTPFSRVHYRAQDTLPLGAAINPLPNISASYMRADTTGYPASATLLVRVGNNGGAPSTQVNVAFYRSVQNGSPILVGTATTGAIAAGAYQDVTTTISNPAAGSYSFFAIADYDGKLIECNESDNTSPFVAARFSADVAVDPTSLFVTDPQPRPGDTISFTANATLSGAVDTAALTAQFYRGDPNAGGTAISPLLNPTIVSIRGQRYARADFSWTVTAPSGPAGIFVVFDAANRIPEDSETNNSGTFGLNISTAEAIQKLSGTVTLNPPSAEPGTPVSVQILVQNIGNVPLTNVVLNYTVGGGAGTGFTGSATIASIAKNAASNVSLGSFTPTVNGNYDVIVTAADPAITLIAGAKQIRVAPFAGAELTAVPLRVPTSLPLVQCHTRVTRGNTIVIPDDPLVPLIKAHIQRGLIWQAPVLTSAMNEGCYKCHVQSQGMVGFEGSLQVAGITVDPLVEQRMFDMTVSSQNPDGHFGVSGYPRSTTILGAWSLSFWHNPIQAQPTMLKALNAMLSYQNGGGPDTDGSFDCDHCDISYGNREAMTMMAMVALARGYDETGDVRYLNALKRSVNWALQWDYAANAGRGPEYAARISIGLSAALPKIADPSLSHAIENRIRLFAANLKSLQNDDGSFGTTINPPIPIVRNAQVLYALALSGIPGTDPQLRASIIWLLNHQQTNGGWTESLGESQVQWIDETTWAMIALPAAFARLGQFDVNLDIKLPDGTDFVSSNIAPGFSAVNGGRQMTWKFPDVSEQGIDLYFNVRLNGLQHDETRPATGPASISYRNPYSGDAVTRPISVPSITGYAPLKLDVSTDKAAYPSNSIVTIAEKVTNVGATTDGITNDLVIRDANGTTVATLATADPVQGLPPSPFPGWHYTIPLSMPVTNDGLNRIAIINVNFTQKLAELGLTGAFDRNSIRVTADSAPSSELYFTWLPSDANPNAGKVLFTVPDSAGSGTTLNVHVYFDTLENGFKPASMFDRGATGATGGSGFIGRYYNLDTSRQTGYVSFENQVFRAGPPLVTEARTETYMADRFPAGVPGDFFVADWDGAFYVPAAGAYQFELGSDDGSWLDIDDVQVINNGWGHGVQMLYATVQLSAGFHKFHISMFEWGGGQWLSWRWAPPGQGWSSLPPQSLYPGLPAGNETSTVIGATQLLSDGNVTKTYTWNTGSTASAQYSAVGTIRQFGGFVASGAAPFTISPAAQVSGSIATDKPAYDANETVHVTGAVQFGTGNTTLHDLTATLSIADPSGATIAQSQPTAIASLIPGQSISVRYDWPTAAAAAGAYSAKLIVKDSAGAAVANAAVPFTIRATSTTGKGVTGTISAPAVIQQGESLPLAVTLTNGGNTALTDAPFAIRILDPATQDLVATIAFNKSIGAGVTSSADQTYASASLRVQTYDAYLISLITGTPVLLAKTTFEVKVPPLKLDLAVSGPARVLIWANCSPGNSGKPCTAVAPPFLTKTLDDAHIPWTLVGEQNAFLNALRTGAYNEAILYQPSAFEAKIATEYLQSIRAGFGLLYINNDTDANPKLAEALATKFGGKLNAQSTTLDLVATPFSTAGQLVLNGSSVKIDLDGAQTAAKISATQLPAITYNTYGAGRVVVLPYDTELTPTADVAKLLLGIVNWIPRPAAGEARSVVPIDFLVTPPPGSAVDLTIGATLPSGMTVVFAQPALTSASPLSWNITANGTPLHLTLWVRLPEAAGTYTITGTAAFRGQTAVVTKTIAVTVTADRVAMESALAADLSALAASAPAKDQKAVGDAQSELTAIRAANPTTAAAAAALVDRAINIINDLQSVSVSTTAARASAGRLLVYWQSRAGV